MIARLKGKRILVAGANGFIGANLLKNLLGSDLHIRGTYFRNKPKINDDRIEYLQLNLENKKDCETACKDIDIVFMCAANSSGAAVIETTPLVHLTPNVVMNSLMLEAAYTASVGRFVFISSNTVYPHVNFAVKEGDVNYQFFDKYHIVGWMKLFSEEMCKMYSSHIKSPMSTLVVRPGNLYGPYDKFNPSESKVIAALVRRFFLAEEPLEVWGDGNDIKDFLYIDDFIDALLSVSMDYNFNGPINIASGVPHTIKDVINALALITKRRDLVVNYDAAKPTMIPVRLINCFLLNSQFKWSPKYSLFEGLKKTYDWYFKNN